MPAVRQLPPDRGLIARIVDAPHAALVVRQLQPEILHRVIQVCGLEDSADLVALATPAQLQRIFDLDLWRQERAGTDEQLDPDRFATWIEVLMEAGPAVAAEKLAGMDADIVITALAQHVLVFDPAAVALPPVDDGDVEPMVRMSDRPSREVGGYLVEARRTATWETIADLLVSLDAAHPEFFHRVMRGCRQLSNSGFEIDGLDDLLDAGDQGLFDVAVARDQRREGQGYLTPAEARAFLQAARQIDRRAAAPPPNPIAQAYFRTAASQEPVTDITEAAGECADPADVPPGTAAPAAAMADVMDALSEAGVLKPQPRALLAAAPEDARARLARLEPLLEFAREIDPRAWAKRTEELAFVANALVAGGSMQSRPFTPKEASEAAAAICNLGLENWPAAARTEVPALPNGVTAGTEVPALRSGAAAGTEVPALRSEAAGTAPLPDDFLVANDLIAAFQIGWTVLYEDVCVSVSERLARVLAEVQTSDPAIRAALDALRFELVRSRRNGTPWTPGLELDAIIMLDKPAWAALVGLLSECPVLHAAVEAIRTSSTRPIDPTAFEFIAENRQIEGIRQFMALLPGIFR
ncbi:MAG TPA: DUF6178 family protein [Vicinamibacterales bacterium]